MLNHYGVSRKEGVVMNMKIYNSGYFTIKYGGGKSSIKIRSAEVYHG